MGVTVTYTYPVAGIVAPAAAQMKNANAVVATVTATADSDTTAVITHNMGLSVAQLAAGQPFVTITGLLTAAGISLWYVSATATNSVTLTKATTGSSGNASPQIQVVVNRPHSFTMDGNFTPPSN